MGKDLRVEQCTLAATPRSPQPDPTDSRERTVVPNTISDTVDVLYTIDPANLSVDQQIALAQAYGTLAQAERLDWIYQRLDKIHQTLTALALRVPDLNHR